MKKLNIKNKEIQLLVLLGVLTILFISVNFANNYSPQGNYIFDDKLPKSAAITININSPIPNSNFSATEPAFEVEISEDTFTINTTWYTLNTNQTKHIFTSNGTIDGWSYLNDGLVNITFYANNSVSTIKSDYVLVTKDTVDPGVPILFTSDPLSWTNTDSFDLSWSNPADTSGI